MYPPFTFRNTICVKIFILYMALIITLLFILKENASFKTRQRRHDESLNFAPPYLAITEEPPFSPETATENDENPASVSKASTQLPSEEEEEWELNRGNVPELSMMMQNGSSRPKWYSAACAKFPDLFTVQFSNIYWQVQETFAETYHLYSAYLDMRGDPSPHPNHPFDNALIRILGMSNMIRLNGSSTLLKSCQFWFSHQTTPVFGKVIDIRMLWDHRWGRNAVYFPYLLTCQVPKGLKDFPVSVSLATTHCANATNNLNIIHRDRAFSSHAKYPENDFAVCVKALDFPDVKMRSRLVEWIEMLRLLGAHKIFFYEYFVESEIEKVLDYYKNLNVVHVSHTTLPGSLPNQAQLRHHFIRKRTIQKRLTELIPYNDCFYRNMYDFKYIAVMDTDELLMPTEHITWSNLINVVKKVDIGFEALQKRPVTTFCFRNFYYLDVMMEGKEHEVSSIPQQFHMLRHIYRSKNSTRTGYMKCFHSTEETLGVHNHFAFFCRGGKRCVRYTIDETRGKMNHYRSTCVRELKTCSGYLNNTVKDTKLWRYKDQLINRMELIKSALNF